MKNKLIKKITAAAMAFSLVGGAVSAPVDKSILSCRIFTANAEDGLDNILVTPEKEPTATYDEERNILTVSGNVDRSTFGGYLYHNDITIIADSETVLPEDCSELFMWSYAKTIDLSNADTSNVKDMNNMFQGCQNLQSVDLGYLNTNNVTDMHEMFSGCNNLESIDMTDFDTSNVERMDSMFFCCSSLKSLDLGSFDTANVTSMAFMFSICSSLEYIDVTGFDTSKVQENPLMFGDCTALVPSICIVKGNSVTLDGSIGVNVYIQPCEKLAKVIMSGPDGNREYTDFTGAKQSSGDYKFTYPVNATQGNEQITLKAYDKDGKRLIICDKYYGLCDHSQVECTVYGYISKVKKSDVYSDEILAALVDGLENYCKAAQNYFNGTDNTIGGIDNVTADSVIEYATDLGDDVKLSLVLNSTVALRFYTDNNDVIIDGKKATAKYKGDKKYYEISNICAQQLCTSHKIIIDGMDYSCSALSYVHRVLNNSEAENNMMLVNMAKSTYIYAKAA